MSSPAPAARRSGSGSPHGHVTTGDQDRAGGSYFAEHAWLDDAVARDVRLSVHSGRFTDVQAGAVPQPADVRLPGLVLPGFANTHSHAFHRALRGRTHDSGSTFWTWRERMYWLAGRLDPDSYLALARATYAEMALTGIACVGEFHYIHHGTDGKRYADANAMGQAVIQGAREAGIRITLLDTCYLTAGIDGEPLSGPVLRFGDGSVQRWAGRVATLRDAPGVRIGAAVHSVRAVPRGQLQDVVAAATSRDRPLHAHVSEQPAENEQCVRRYGLTPTGLLDEAGALGPGFTAVHATHVTGVDVRRLGASRSFISVCPTTERDLADGIGPARALLEAGASLTLGTDQHAMIDMLGEARALEMDERLASGRRGRFTPAELVRALTAAGQSSLDWDDAGRIAPGARADLVAIRLDTARTAGADLHQALLAATAADIDTVIVDGRTVVQGGHHVLGDVAALLRDAITPLWQAD